MAIFVVVNCKKRKPILATLSARKATGMLKNIKSGLRVEVWDNSVNVMIAYPKDYYKLNPYIELEKQFIGKKQKKAEKRNRFRRSQHDR